MNHDIVPVPDVMMVSVFVSEKLMRIKDLDPAMYLSQTWSSPLDWRSRLGFNRNLLMMFHVPALTTQKVSRAVTSWIPVTLRTPDWTRFHEVLGVLRHCAVR